MERSLRTLRQLRAKGRDAFVSDEAVQDRAERHAQLLAQACADVALHILAGGGVTVPETYAEAIASLGPAGVVSAELATRVAEAARLRNLLVHAYLDVDHGRLFDELGWIEDAAVFAREVGVWLQAHDVRP
jgi:uncharacterized protein YutE (UPF0331/DUF86 family)